MPLQEVANGEWRPAQVHVPFSFQDLRQIKQDLGKFSDDPDKYIEAFQGLILTFELAWKDVMLILDQTLTGGEKEKVIRGALEFDEWYTINASGKSPEELTRLPTDCQAVPFTDPEWGQDTDDADNWYRNHFI